MEIYTKMSNADALFAYVSNLKNAIQTQIMLHNPANLIQTILYGLTDSMIWFSNHHKGLQ